MESDITVFDRRQADNKYHAIAYKTVSLPEGADNVGHTLLENIFHDNFSFDIPKSRFGNEDGLALLDREEAMASDVEKILRELSGIKGQIETLQEQNTALKTGHAELYARHSELKTNHSELKTNHSALKTGHAELYASHLELKTNHSELETNHSALKTGHAELYASHLELETSHSELKTSHSELEGKSAMLENDLLFSRMLHTWVRYGVLEDRRISNGIEIRKDPIITISRNEVAQGGDIIGDIQAIKYAQAQNLLYIEEYKNGFQNAYGIPFDEALTQVPSYPPEAIKTFNIFASISEVRHWQHWEQRQSRGIIKQQAIKIINAVLGTERAQLKARFGSEGDLRETFDGMVRLYMNGRSQDMGWSTWRQIGLLQ